MPSFWPFSKKTRKKSASLRELLEDGGGNSSSGKKVTTSTSIEVAAVFACARVISEGIAQVPVKLMREQKGQRLPARDRFLYDVLATAPNEWQTAFEYWEMVGWHVALAGAHYSYINRASSGDVLELLPFEPGQVSIKREKSKLTYEVTMDGGGKKTIPAQAMFVIRGPSWNGWEGIDPIAQARDAIGLAMAIEEDASSRHKNGIQTSGTYSVEGKLTQDQHAKLTKWLKEHYAGSANSGAPMVLDRAAKFNSIQMSAIDAQSYENRRFQIEEICRFFRVNPIMVGAESKNTTYASAEQMFLAHLVHTLSPWYTRIEKAIDSRLLTDKDRKAGLYADFVEEGLLRGSAEATMNIILGYVNGGLMTPNEGRAKLDMNPDADPASDSLRIPTNIVGADGAEE